MNAIKTLQAISGCAQFWRLRTRLPKILTRSDCYRQNGLAAVFRSARHADQRAARGGSKRTQKNDIKRAKALAALLD
jgi:hypothetical protein